MIKKNYSPYVLTVLLLTAFETEGQNSIKPDAAVGNSVQKASATRVVLIGTGTPAIDPDRSGPCTAIVVNDTAYLVDMGPGLVRRARSAQVSRAIPALDPMKFRIVFVTHLHSDHTVGYPDLIFSPWTLGRRFPLEVYGPKGIKSMTAHLLEAYREDIETRTNPHGNQRDFPGGHKVNAHEITSGVIYKDNNVTVTAFATKHAMESYGYRFDTKDRSIVISGDTNPTEATIAACNNCDVLIHEAHSPAWIESRPETFQKFSSQYHTTTHQLSELAKRAKPKLLILYHCGGFSLEEIFREMSTFYPGHFVVSRDLDVY
jgi:ribonuclease Z